MFYTDFSIQAEQASSTKKEKFAYFPSWFAQVDLLLNFPLRISCLCMPRLKNRMP